MFGNINLSAVEENPNFVKERSAHEGWADSKYYIPSNNGNLKRVYMDGMYFSYNRVGDIFTAKVENTYDGRGWTVRDIVQGSISLVADRQNITICPLGYTETTGSETLKANVKKQLNILIITIFVITLKIHKVITILQ